MKSLKIFVTFLCILFNTILYAHELSICTIFQDEGKYLPEWIEFHLARGVDHFYLYNNNSTDNFQEYVDPFINQGLLTVINWPFKYNNVSDWNRIQCGAYIDCVKNYGKESDWIAFLDVDEFLFCPDGTNLAARLNDYKKYGAVSVCWMMYGTSNINVPDGEKIVNYLCMRANEINKHVKTIAQPKYIKNIENPHYMVLKNKLQVTEHKNSFFGPFSPSPSVDLLRINHYWSRDLDFFHNVKIPRREEWYHDGNKILQMEKEMNAVYDPILANIC